MIPLNMHRFYFNPAFFINGMNGMKWAVNGIAN